jgi:hypothetical protein
MKTRISVQVQIWKPFGKVLKGIGCEDRGVDGTTSGSCTMVLLPQR